MDSHEQHMNEFVSANEMNNLVHDYLMARMNSCYTFVLASDVLESENACSPLMKANGHTGVAMALQNDLQKTKLKNEFKVKATEESVIREQASF